MTKKTSKKKSKKPTAAKKKAARRKNQALTDQQRAQMWVLRTEGHSLREIGKEIGCDARTVSREFEKDPARHASIVRAQAEERAAVWRKIENRSLHVLLNLVEDVQKALWTPTGRRCNVKTQKFKDETERLELVRKLIGPLRMAADSATNKSQLLTGGATEIIAQGDSGGLGLDPSKMTEDEIIRLAIAHGLEDDLPQALQEKIKTMGKSDNP